MCDFLLDDMRPRLRLGASSSSEEIRVGVKITLLRRSGSENFLDRRCERRRLPDSTSLSCDDVVSVSGTSTLSAFRADTDFLIDFLRRFFLPLSSLAAFIVACDSWLVVSSSLATRPDSIVDSLGSELVPPMELSRSDVGSSVADSYSDDSVDWKTSVWSELSVTLSALGGCWYDRD
jgi:hypothetical protein